MKFLYLLLSAYRYKKPEFLSNQLSLEKVPYTTFKPFIQRAKLIKQLMPCLNFYRSRFFGPQLYKSQPRLRQVIQIRWVEELFFLKPFSKAIILTSKLMKLSILCLVFFEKNLLVNYSNPQSATVLYRLLPTFQNFYTKPLSTEYVSLCYFLDTF